MGDASVASQAKGDRILASLADGWVEVIKDIYRF